MYTYGLLKLVFFPYTGDIRIISFTWKAFSESYEGVLVKFNLKKDAFNELKSIGVKDTSELTGVTYPDMPGVSIGWKDNNVFFKTEDEKINLCLGSGKEWDIFNQGIASSERLN